MRYSADRRPWHERLVVLGQDPDEIHQGLVRTFGNLTLTASDGMVSKNPSSARPGVGGQVRTQVSGPLTARR